MTVSSVRKNLVSSEKKSGAKTSSIVKAEMFVVTASK